MLTAYAKKMKVCICQRFSRRISYRNKLHLGSSRKPNRPDIWFFFSSAVVMHFAELLWLSKWQFCFCTIIHWILNCYQCRVEGNGIHKTSDPLFWTLLVHQVPWRLITFSTWELLLMQEKKHHTLSHMKCEPISLPASHVMDIVLYYGAIPQRKPILPHLLPFYLPFPCVMHHALQVDILIVSALVWEWEETVRSSCFSKRTGYRCTSPTCDTWHCRSTWFSDVLSLGNLPHRCFGDKTLIRNGACCGAVKNNGPVHEQQ